VVLGAPALEESPGVRRGPARLALWAVLLAGGVVAAPGAVQAVGEDPVAEISEALRALGPPGGVWGRLSVEEESPVGAWTPLDGIEITLYPATPTLVAELEQIRQSARGSAAQYESAVTRVQSALAVHQGRIDRQTAQPPTLGDLLVAEPPRVKKAPPKAAMPASEAKSSRAAGSSWSTGGSRLPSVRTTLPPSAPAASSSKASQAEEESEHLWRQKTDPAGLFAFPTVPSGDWLVVAVRVAPYAAEKLRAAPKPRQSTRTQGFLPRTLAPAKEVELWVTRIHVVKEERVALDLTDRARWLVGPIR
jgi:hypothetical protein